MNTISIEFIRKALQETLPGFEAQKKMLPKGRTLIAPENKVKESAIMILLFPVNNELNICFTKRNTKLKHHPGQISFPGGRCEKHETDPSTTAFRETEEEIGVNRNEIELLGKLSKLYISVSNFNIHPYVGFMAEKPTLTINSAEVENEIILPLRDFLSDKNQSNELIQTSKGLMKVPCYKIDGHIIWGATSMMIAELEAILRKHYSHREEHSDNAGSDREY